MARYRFFLFTLFLISCNNEPGADNYISEDSLRIYKQRDSLLNVLKQQLTEKSKETGSVVWAGKNGCSYLIIKTPAWYYVAENNYKGGVYEQDIIKASFIQYGNIEAYDETSGSNLNLFIQGYYSTEKSAANYIKFKCGLNEDIFTR